MTPIFQRLASTLQAQVHATQTRSDVLRALRWFTGIMLTGTLLSFGMNTPAWFIILMSALFTISAALYLITFVVCLFKNPDALRSETYSLNKMAIERGYYGDNLSGVMRSLPEAGEPTDAAKLLPRED